MLLIHINLALNRVNKYKRAMSMINGLYDNETNAINVDLNVKVKIVKQKHHFITYIKKLIKITEGQVV